MSDPVVSVVTPSYEQVDYLEDNLQSVKGQTGLPVEHVVVDGGSTDGTVDLLREYEDEYALRWISESDGGQSEAVNKGIEMARGEWICWVNSDDYLVEDAISRFADARRRFGSKDVIYGDFVFVDADGRKVGWKYNTKPSRFVHKHYYQFTGNHSTFFSREVFDRVGTLDEALDYTMDTEFLWRVLNSDLDLVHVRELFGARRLHEAAKTTGTPLPDRQGEIDRLRATYPQSFGERVLPRKVLTGLAFGLQSLYHLSDGRPKAIGFTRV